MDLPHFLNRRMDFVLYFHANAAAGFKEVKRKIEQNEDPYVDQRNPEYADGPAFLQEWEHANTAITVVGAACLDLVQSTLHAFLIECLRELHLEEYVPRIKEKGRKGWFLNFRAFFEEDLMMNWSASGADLELLEQMILARNDFTHNTDFTSLKALQSSSHSTRYPDSVFADPLFKDLWFAKEHTPIVIPEEKLTQVIESVCKLGAHLEAERYAWIRRNTGKV